MAKAITAMLSALALLGVWPAQVAGTGGGRNIRRNDKGVQNGRREACNHSPLDPFKNNPRGRGRYVRDLREEWTDIEFRTSRDMCQDTSNSDWSSAARFHKTLPHDKYGRVNASAFEDLRECVTVGDFDTCDAIAQGDSNGRLVNPLGGISVNMEGPASTGVGCPATPALDSEEMAAQLAEVYWMSLTRDVPFSQYGENSTTIKAATNLAKMPGYKQMGGVSGGQQEHRPHEYHIDPYSQLFRCSFVGVETGPMISQLLVKSFSMDSIEVVPKQKTAVTGKDYMTDYHSWLHIQNGGSYEEEELDDTKRYIRNSRDLARLVYTDNIYTEAFRGAFVLMEHGAISHDGLNGPYADSKRQEGFVDFGRSHLMRTLGSLELAMKSAWYQKWNVHLMARPEALAGTLHNVMNGKIMNVFHEDLLMNHELLRRVAEHNDKQNKQRSDSRWVYMLSQATAGGSPSHPSYPAGHAVQNGAFATVLKAFVGLEKGGECFSHPVYPDDDGLELKEWGGECLTYEGEINKLAFNVAYGRSMCGVHYRMDSHEGLLLGEVVGVRRLHQEIMSFPEKHYWEFRLFTGETIKLNYDGKFFINGKRCRREGFTGVDKC